MKNALLRWAEELVREHRNIAAIGYFGSYARGDWGVGSDLDLVIIVEDSSQPLTKRGVEIDATGLPVPADLLVYTVQEWHEMRKRDTRFHKVLIDETIWIYPPGPPRTKPAGT